MRPAWLMVVLLLAGCASPFERASCSSRVDPDAQTGTSVHVDVLNDANKEVRVCYRIVGGAVHAFDTHRSSAAPNVGHALDAHANGTPLRLEAWLAGDDARVHRDAWNASSETWFVITVQSGGVSIEWFDIRPGFA